jgi:hypothetical protein
MSSIGVFMFVAYVIGECARQRSSFCQGGPPK